jgi:hypothetical protein
MQTFNVSQATLIGLVCLSTSKKYLSPSATNLVLMNLTIEFFFTTIPYASVTVQTGSTKYIKFVMYY